MDKVHQYRMTEAHLDYLMTLGGDQLITIITRLTDRTASIVSALYDDGVIPKETQEVFHIEEIERREYI